MSRDSKIGPVRVNHKVSTTGDGTRKQGDVEISNFPISLLDGLVIDVSFVCEFKGRSRAPGGWDNVVHTLIPPPKCTTATLELTHKGNINDKTIPERDREVRDFNVTLLTRRRHLVNFLFFFENLRVFIKE